MAPDYTGSEILTSTLVSISIPYYIVENNIETCATEAPSSASITFVCGDSSEIVVEDPSFVLNNNCERIVATARCTVPGSVSIKYSIFDGTDTCNDTFSSLYSTNSGYINYSNSFLSVPDSVTAGDSVSFSIQVFDEYNNVTKIRSTNLPTIKFTQTSSFSSTTLNTIYALSYDDYDISTGTYTYSQLSSGEYMYLHVRMGDYPFPESPAAITVFPTAPSKSKTIIYINHLSGTSPRTVDEDIYISTTLRDLYSNPVINGDTKAPLLSSSVSISSCDSNALANYSGSTYPSSAFCSGVVTTMSTVYSIPDVSSVSDPEVSSSFLFSPTISGTYSLTTTVSPNPTCMSSPLECRDEEIFTSFTISTVFTVASGSSAQVLLVPLGADSSPSLLPSSLLLYSSFPLYSLVVNEIRLKARWYDQFGNLSTNSASFVSLNDYLDISMGSSCRDEEIFTSFTISTVFTVASGSSAQVLLVPLGADSSPSLLPSSLLLYSSFPLYSLVVNEIRLKARWYDQFGNLSTNSASFESLNDYLDISMGSSVTESLAASPRTSNTYVGEEYIVSSYFDSSSNSIFMSVLILDLDGALCLTSSKSSTFSSSLDDESFEIIPVCISGDAYIGIEEISSIRKDLLSRPQSVFALTSSGDSIELSAVSSDSTEVDIRNRDSSFPLFVTNNTNSVLDVSYHIDIPLPSNIPSSLPSPISLFLAPTVEYTYDGMSVQEGISFSATSIESINSDFLEKLSCSVSGIDSSFEFDPVSVSATISFTDSSGSGVSSISHSSSFSISFSSYIPVVSESLCLTLIPFSIMLLLCFLISCCCVQCKGYGCECKASCKQLWCCCCGLAPPSLNDVFTKSELQEASSFVSVSAVPNSRDGNKLKRSRTFGTLPRAKTGVGSKRGDGLPFVSAFSDNTEFSSIKRSGISSPPVFMQKQPRRNSRDVLSGLGHYSMTIEKGSKKQLPRRGGMASVLSGGELSDVVEDGSSSSGQILGKKKKSPKFYDEMYSHKMGNDIVIDVDTDDTDSSAIDVKKISPRKDSSNPSGSPNSGSAFELRMALLKSSAMQFRRPSTVGSVRMSTSDDIW
ncbi:hypothetical protein ADUPG1_005977 [Aduncisulcus paluster]|uniref:Uncharacterized protein n=1 Tax=Aduncisulcus paluster TaxID=2918883 RepID=A0ABQ5KGB8_9EUKA|nr:hypothetical protein ADUPG1_005977 [Aduncisulcus paluster]